MGGPIETGILYYEILLCHALIGWKPTGLFWRVFSVPWWKIGLLKRPWDYIFHNFRYTFQKLQISPQSVNLKVIKVFQVSNLISMAIESSDRPVNSRESFEWWKIEEKWENLKSLLFAHSDQFKRLQWAFLGQKLKKIFQNGPNKLKTGIKVGFWPILTSFLGCFSQSGKELKRRIFELYTFFLKRCFSQN